MLRSSMKFNSHFLLKVNVPVHKSVRCRFYHIVYPTGNVSLARKTLINNRIRSSLAGTYAVRNGSFSSFLARIFGSNDDKYNVPPDLLEHIPDPPTVTGTTTDVVEKIIEYHANGEPTFSSIGLGGYYPPGLIQSAMEWLHISAELPWWSTIIICTLTVRILLFPLIIKTQRSSAKFRDFMPKVQAMQNEIKEAKMSGNVMEATIKAQEMMKFVQNSKIRTRDMFLPTLIQGPILISFFMALREMANLPVVSMQEGGLWWFSDLTATDPYYLLPFMTSLTLFITLEVGADVGKFGSTGFAKYALRCIPPVVFLCIMNTSSAVLLYWTSTNFISLLQVSTLKIPAVRKFFNLPDIPNVPMSFNAKGFLKEFNESWENMKVARKLKQMETATTRQFQSAGRNPAQKTYKYDPTKLHVIGTTTKNKL